MVFILHAVLQALQLQSFEWFSKKHEFHINKVYDLGIKKITYLVSLLDKQLVAKKHKHKKSKLSSWNLKSLDAFRMSCEV